MIHERDNRTEKFRTFKPIYKCVVPRIVLEFLHHHPQTLLLFHISLDFLFMQSRNQTKFSAGFLRENEWVWVCVWCRMGREWPEDLNLIIFKIAFYFRAKWLVLKKRNDWSSWGFVLWWRLGSGKWLKALAPDPKKLWKLHTFSAKVNACWNP